MVTSYGRGRAGNDGERAVSKADAVLEREQNFYRVFSIVKYSYLPTDTFRKYVEMDVTFRKLAFQFTGYGRQTR